MPEFHIITSVGWGELDDPARHRNYDFKTMEKGYYESGLSIRDVYKMWGFMGLGIAGFYRYGPYSFPDTIDNWAVKLAIKYSL